MNFVLLGLLTVLIISGCTQTQDTTEFENQIQSLQTENTSLQQEKTQLQQETTQLKEEKDSTVEFFKDYSISLVNIHLALNNLRLAQVNLNNANYDSDAPEGYIYSSIVALLDGGIGQVADTESLLSRAKRKLQDIENYEPNSFFKNEVQNRLQHIELITNYSNDLKLLLEHRKNELYEVNYGSEEKAQEFLNKYNDVTNQFNSSLEKLSEIEDIIEIEWDQDWYP